MADHNPQQPPQFGHNNLNTFAFTFSLVCHQEGFDTMHHTLQAAMARIASNPSFISGGITSTHLGRTDITNPPQNDLLRTGIVQAFYPQAQLGNVNIAGDTFMLAFPQDSNNEEPVPAPAADGIGFILTPQDNAIEHAQAPALAQVADAQVVVPTPQVHVENHVEAHIPAPAQAAQVVVPAPQDHDNHHAQDDDANSNIEFRVNNVLK